jgi:hypothetical protein
VALSGQAAAFFLFFLILLATARKASYFSVEAITKSNVRDGYFPELSFIFGFEEVADRLAYCEKRREIQLDVVECDSFNVVEKIPHSWLLTLVYRLSLKTTLPAVWVRAIQTAAQRTEVATSSVEGRAQALAPR